MGRASISLIYTHYLLSDIAFPTHVFFVLERERHTDRERHRKTEKETDGQRQTDKERDRQTKKETD